MNVSIVPIAIEAVAAKGADPRQGLWSETDLLRSEIIADDILDPQADALLGNCFEVTLH